MRAWAKIIACVRRRTAWRVCALGVALACFLVGVLRGEQPLPGDSDVAAAAVATLGSNEFQERESAAHWIVAAGETARAALMSAQHHPDVEIRRRSRDLLAALNTTRARETRLAWEERLDDFVENESTSDTFAPPGWSQFRAIAGAGHDARLLFAEMHRAEPELLAMIESGGAALSTATDKRLTAIRTSLSHPVVALRTPISPGRGAAILFAASGKDVRLPATAGQQIYSMLLQPDFAAALNQSARGDLLRKLLGNWVAQPENIDGAAAVHKLSFALRHNLKEGLAPALRIIKQEGTRPHQFLQAIQAVGRFGGKENMADLEPLLKNSSVVYTLTSNNTKYTTEVRDVALAVLLHVTNQDATEYGFGRLQKSPQTLFTPNSAGFAADDREGREAALAKWRRWKAGQVPEEMQKAE